MSLLGFAGRGRRYSLLGKARAARHDSKKML